MSVNKSIQPAVLLVDDEEHFVETLAKRLTRCGISVMSASSGSEAILVLRENRFDVAVLDLKMEDMDGLEVLKIFKKVAPEMAVIMLTGHGSEQAVRDGLALGAYDYLNKPCDLDILLNTIRNASEEGSD
jgi:DNA-binding NtrC family response regulator